MIAKIQSTEAYKGLNPIAQKMINKRSSFIRIQDAVIQARNLGIQKWRTQNDLPTNWKAIVEEIVNENNS